MFEDKLIAIVKGALFGAEAALIGYLKSENLETGIRALFTKEFWSKFDPPKALKTVILGAIMGAFLDFTMFVPDEWKSSPDYIAIVAIVPSLAILATETVIKAIVRRTPLMMLWNKAKDAAISFLEKLQK